MYKEQLLARLNDRTATIGIVGLGYVGLPLAVAFAEDDFNVIGLDVNPQKVATLNGAVSYIPDIPTEQIVPLVRSGKLRATISYADLQAADAGRRR
jgi:UDP-N-acetyl-D-glucosamine dehydrogenase